MVMSVPASLISRSRCVVPRIVHYRIGNDECLDHTSAIRTIRLRLFLPRDAAFADDQFNGATALPLIRSALGTY